MSNQTQQSTPIVHTKISHAFLHNMDPHLLKRNIYEVNGWRFETQTGPISNATTLATFEEKSSVTAPEMSFLDNSYSVTHVASGISLCFNTRGALYGCLLEDQLALLDGKAGLSYIASPDHHSNEGVLNTVKVVDASLWEKTKDNTIHSIMKYTYDWTYTSKYKGHIIDSNLLPKSKSESAKESIDVYDYTDFDLDMPYFYSKTHVEPEESKTDSVNVLSTPWVSSSNGIDYEKLKIQETILDYTDIVLFEDELHDNGSACVSVKARVMKSGFFILYRFFLRVDLVIVRVIDTRYYHAFGTDEIIREVKIQELSLDQEMKEQTQQSQATSAQSDDQGTNNTFANCKKLNNGSIIPPQHQIFYSTRIDEAISKVPVLLLVNEKLNIKDFKNKTQ